MKRKGLILNLSQDCRWYPAGKVTILAVAEDWMLVKESFFRPARWVPNNGIGMRVVEVLETNRETTKPFVNPEAKIGFKS